MRVAGVAIIPTQPRAQRIQARQLGERLDPGRIQRLGAERPADHARTSRWSWRTRRPSSPPPPGRVDHASAVGPFSSGLMPSNWVPSRARWASRFFATLKVAPAARIRRRSSVASATVSPLLRVTTIIEVSASAAMRARRRTPASPYGPSPVSVGGRMRVDRAGRVAHGPRRRLTGAGAGPGSPVHQPEPPGPRTCGPESWLPRLPRADRGPLNPPARARAVSDRFGGSRPLPAGPRSGPAYLRSRSAGEAGRRPPARPAPWWSSAPPSAHRCPWRRSASP